MTERWSVVGGWWSVVSRAEAISSLGMLGVGKVGLPPLVFPNEHDAQLLAGASPPSQPEIGSLLY